jgi:hypothetical protein
MSILAHNLYRLLALELERYQHLTDERIYEMSMSLLKINTPSEMNIW